MLGAVPFDALVVLGCRVRGGALSHAALRRVERAAQAYAEEGALLVIASGGKLWEGHQECDVFAHGLLARGVPSERLLAETTSLTTLGNARGVAALLRDRPRARVGVVTCDWHVPRALTLFRRVGLPALGVPATSPARPLPVVALRALRERLSLALDLALSPLGLVP
jgi:uncharacterized SAM-binding protein YcdF (DUF218 family)